MGVFGNGRFFETLLIKMRSSSLAEHQELANTLQEELNKVVPSFVRRAMPDHKHLLPAKEFLQVTHQALKPYATVFTMSDDKAPSVLLAEYDEDAEEKVVAALLYPHSHQSFQALREHVKLLPESMRAQIIRASMSGRSNRRHKPSRAFENAQYTFDIIADFGTYKDLERHRMLTQQRQHYTVEHGYGVPQEIIDAGFELEWTECMEAVAYAYREIAKDLPEQAQYVITHGTHVRWYFTINARSLYWLTELRSQPQGHPNYRKVAQELYRLARETHQSLFEHATYVDMNDYALGRLQAETRQAQKQERKDQEKN